MRENLKSSISFGELYEPPLKHREQLRFGMAMHAEEARQRSKRLDAMIKQGANFVRPLQEED